jgi:hypothetical protein
MSDKDIRKRRLFRNAYESWRGKAGGYAKSKNTEMLKLANRQSIRYGTQYFDLLGFTDEQKYMLLKVHYTLC